MDWSVVVTSPSAFDERYIFSKTKGKAGERANMVCFPVCTGNHQGKSKCTGKVIAKVRGKLRGRSDARIRLYARFRRARFDVKRDADGDVSMDIDGAEIDFAPGRTYANKVKEINGGLLSRTNKTARWFRGHLRKK